MSKLNGLTIAATAIGLALALWMLGRVGIGQTFAVLAGLGLGGFLLFLGCWSLVLVALGGAWSSARTPPQEHFFAFVLARTVREAANELLPFSQLGGFVLGLRALTASGVAQVPAYAATIVDLTTEILSQLLLVLIGVAITIEALAGSMDPGLKLAIWSGVGLLCLFCLAMLTLRAPMMALVTRMAGRVVPSAGALLAEVHAELARFEAKPLAMLPSFLWNLAAWLLSVVCVWLALHLLGHGISPLNALALEVLISVVRSSAFLIPGAVGAQEAGYVLLAGLFGLTPDAALALSFL